MPDCCQHESHHHPSARHGDYCPECGCHRGACTCGHHGGCRCGCHQASGCRCGCHAGPSGFQRRFRSRAEVIAELEEYLEALRAEAQAVEERIAELRG